MDLFNINRVVASAQGVGVAQGALDKAVAYMRERSAFGSTLASFQGLQFKVADMAARIESARALYHKAAWTVDQGQVDRKLVSIAKLVAGETAVRVTDEALQLHGGYGYMDEYDVERFYGTPRSWRSTRAPKSSRCSPLHGKSSEVAETEYQFAFEE